LSGFATLLPAQCPTSTRAAPDIRPACEDRGVSAALASVTHDRCEPGDELIAFLYPDVSGLNRGRAVPARDLERRLATGVGWVPADQAITVLGPLAEPNPWGTIGDLRLVPDPATRTRVDLWPDRAALHFYLCEARTLDGEPWDACPRALLRSMLMRFAEETGLRLWAAFEHEFVLQGHTPAPAPPFSMESLRLAEPFGTQLSAALRLAGQELETFLPEYGDDQFEVTCAPREGLEAADAASIVRELVRDVARHQGWRASFTPIVRPDGSGNGLHLHMSFRGADGAPATYDDSRPGGLSLVAGRFAAGLLRHMPALCAVAAPTTVSYLRLQPHRWSAATSGLAEANREAVLRIPTTVRFGGATAAEDTRLELRIADGASSPHLVLALAVAAGLEGIREALEPPPVLSGSLDGLPPDERERLGLDAVPGSLGQALDAFLADELFRAVVSDDLRTAFVSMKRAELALLDGVSDEDACARYAALY
jgi:glutamine synthetase